MALEGWISAAAVAHIYGKELHEEENFSSVSRRECSRQVVIGYGVVVEILCTYSLCVSRALLEVVRALCIYVPMSTLEMAIVRIMSLSNSFSSSVPYLFLKHIALPWFHIFVYHKLCGGS